MIALVVDGVVYLKADAQTVPRFESEGLGPFSYRAKGATRTLTSYWRMPERLYDDPDELVIWARNAHEAAQRSRPSAKINRGGKPVRGRRLNKAS